jgi:hypothetical protein
VDAVAITRELSRRRLLVAVGLVLGLVCAIVIAYQVTPGLPPKLDKRQYTVGLASAEILVDSPNSQVIDLGAGRVHTDVDALTTRARLLANLMATSPLKDQIARAARIDPRTFVADAPSLGPSLKASPIDARTAGPRTNRMTVYYNESLPIITATAQAPSVGVAARIASSARSELRRYLGSVAAQDKVPDARRLVVEPLGSPLRGIAQRGRSPVLAGFAALLVLVLWCGGIVLTANFARRWRRAAAEEAMRELDERPATPRPPASDGPSTGPGAVAPPPARSVLAPLAPAVAPPARVVGKRPRRPVRRGRRKNAA